MAKLFAALLRLKRGVRYLIAAVVVALLLLGVVLLVQRFEGRSQLSFEEGGAQITNADNVQVFAVRDGFAVLQAGMMTTYDQHGNQMWSYAMGASQTDVTAYAGKNLLAMWSGSELVLLSPEGKVEFSGPMQDEILAVRCGNDQAAVNVKGDEALLVIDRSGRTLDSIAVRADELIDFGFTSDKDQFYVLSLDASGISVRCALSTYQAGKLLTASYVFTDEMLYDARFDDENLYLIGTSNLITLPKSASVEEAKRTVLRGWTLVDAQVTGGKMGLLFAAPGEGGKPDKTRLKYIRDGEMTDLVLPDDCLQVGLYKEQLYGIGSNVLYTRPIKGASGAKETARYASSEILDVPAVLESGCVLLRRADGIWLCSLDQ